MLPEIYTTQIKEKKNDINFIKAYYLSIQTGTKSLKFVKHENKGNYGEWVDGLRKAHDQKIIDQVIGEKNATGYAVINGRVVQLS